MMLLLNDVLRPAESRPQTQMVPTPMCPEGGANGDGEMLPKVARVAAQAATSATGE